MESDSLKIGLFASLEPIIFIGMATLVDERIPIETKNHPFLVIYKDLKQKCSLWRTEDGSEIFGCECITLTFEEAEEILKSDLDIQFISLKQYLKIQKEVFDGKDGETIHRDPGS